MSIAHLDPAATASARLAFRALGRRVVRAPDNLALHSARLMAALSLNGAEPAMGALADMLYGVRPLAADDAHSAFGYVRPRLTRVEAAAIATRIGGPEPASLARRIATRWSVLLPPSLDIPRRRLRCSVDDSRLMAAVAYDAFRRGDVGAQDEFLAHCLICGDVAAFMQARRAILRDQAELPESWLPLLEYFGARAARL